MFFGAVGQKAEVTDTHDAIGQDVEQEAADEFFGIEGHRFSLFFLSQEPRADLTPFSFSFFIFHFGFAEKNQMARFDSGPF